jgi:hypothetical protein
LETAGTLFYIDWKRGFIVRKMRWRERTLMTKRAASFFKFLVRPIDRARGLRRDDSAQALLLTGLMAFLLAVFMLYAVNASETIYRRVQIQNASDAAADAAALWQARGMNMLQSLNNIHYIVDASTYIPMITICIHCLKTWKPCIKLDLCLNPWRSKCSTYHQCHYEQDVCNKCGYYQQQHNLMYQAMQSAELRAIKLAMREMFLESDRYAKANGASPFFEAGKSYTKYSAYAAVKNIFPIDNYLKNCMKAMDDGSGFPLLWEHGRSPGGSNYPMQLGIPALHAVPIVSANMERAWDNLGGRQAESVPLLGYNYVDSRQQGFTWDKGEFPWVLGKKLMETISVPYHGLFHLSLDPAYAKSHGWSDGHYVYAGVPTINWATAISNQIGGMLRFTVQSPPGQKPASMFRYLNPQANIDEISVAPFMSLTASTVGGIIDATDLKGLIKHKEIRGVIKAGKGNRGTALREMPGLGKSEGKGMLMPVELDVGGQERGWFGSKSAADMGIFH